jgi:hypothetical protein
VAACAVCLAGRTFHGDCLYTAITWRLAGRYEVEAYSDSVRRLAPRCYLCGVAATEHAEHVHPARWGGSSLWDNMAGACARCNLRKGHRVGYLTDQQQTRAAVHQAAYRDAYGRCTDEVIAEGLADCERRRKYPTGDPRWDLWEVIPDMVQWFDETGASLKQVTAWVEAGVGLMMARGWLDPANDVDIADEVADIYEELSPRPNDGHGGETEASPDLPVQERRTLGQWSLDIVREDHSSGAGQSPTTMPDAHSGATNM